MLQLVTLGLLVFGAFASRTARVATHTFKNSTGWCKNGIPKGDVCCHSGCGACGGKGCSHLPGGAASCCPGTISGAKRPCEGKNDVACVRPVDPAERILKWCDTGLLNDGVCCPRSCGQCGGAGCSAAHGGAELCCSSSISKAGAFCQRSDDAGCIVPKDKRPPECAAHPTCGAQGLLGDCCPGSGGKDLTCCHQVTPGVADWCHRGIREGDVCCDPNCGRCGGGGCGGLPGGSSMCCTGQIQSAGRLCEQLDDVGCVVPAHRSAECSAHPQCAALGDQGDCCPSRGGSFLACCEK